MTTISLHPLAQALIDRALNVDLFSKVGHAQPSSAVVPVRSWSDAAHLITTDEWISYTEAAANAIFSRLVLADLQNEADKWNDICDVIDEAAIANLLPRIDSKVPDDVPRHDWVIDMIAKVLRLACLERHYAGCFPEVVKIDHYLEMYWWLEKGHLTCGPLEDYPSKHWYVF